MLNFLGVNLQFRFVTVDLQITFPAAANAVSRVPRRTAVTVTLRALLTLHLLPQGLGPGLLIMTGAVGERSSCKA
jgi:hypothetical protein